MRMWCCWCLVVSWTQRQENSVKHKRRLSQEQVLALQRWHCCIGGALCRDLPSFYRHCSQTRAIKKKPLFCNEVLKEAKQLKVTCFFPPMACWRMWKRCRSILFRENNVLDRPWSKDQVASPVAPRTTAEIDPDPWPPRPMTVKTGSNYPECQHCLVAFLNGRPEVRAENSCHRRDEEKKTHGETVSVAEYTLTHLHTHTRSLGFCTTFFFVNCKKLCENVSFPQSMMKCRVSSSHNKIWTSGNDEILLKCLQNVV